MIYLVSGTLGVGKTAFCVCKALSADFVMANFDIVGVKNFVRLPQDPDDWGEIPYFGFRRNMAHPSIVVILDELPEIANQFSRQNSSLVSYLRHSDKLGHTVYLISQRAGHTMKTIRQLAAETYLLFYLLGKRMIIRLDGTGKPCSIPRPCNVSSAYGHYDTSSIVSPHIKFNPRFFPIRKYQAERKYKKMLIYYYIFLFVSVFLIMYMYAAYN